MISILARHFEACNFMSLLFRAVGDAYICMVSCNYIQLCNNLRLVPEIFHAYGFFDFEIDN